MRTNKKLIARTVLLVAAGWFAGCNGNIDSEPNVVLEVSTLNITPVTGTRSSTTGLCVFTITNASATFNNKPKNAVSGPSDAPFNDVVLRSVIVDYVWDDGAAVLGQEFGVSGTVPAGGSVSAQFPVVNNVVLSSGVVPRDGHTATLSLRVFGVTVAGENVTSDPTGGTLAVNSCI